MGGFWKTWMTVWCWGVLVFGAVLALAATPATDAPARAVLGLLGGGPAGAALLDQDAMRFGLGIQGALSIGWALTLLAARDVADAAGGRAWRGIAAGVCAWFAIDSTISVVTGFPLNAVSNTLIIAMFLAPVLGSGVLHKGAATAA
jgi:hypothetical protein